MNINFSKKNINNKKAFTLIEALVAIAVLMVAITGPMILAQKSLSAAESDKDQAIAGSLAQDAIETVLGVRDQISKNGSPGDDWLTGPASNPQGFLYPCLCTTDDTCNFNSVHLRSCTIDTTSTVLDGSNIQPAQPPVPKLTMTYNVNSQGATSFLKYGYDGYVNNVFTPSSAPSGEVVKLSKFTRYITVRKNPANDGNTNEAVISVKVSWDSSSGIQSIIPVQDFIYNYSANL